MYHKDFFTYLVIFMSCLCITKSIAQIGIGTTSPDESSILDVSSTNKGILLPRMTTSERNAISSPALGLVVFNSEYNCLNVYTGMVWQGIGTCDYSSAISFSGSPVYNGVSLLGSQGIGYSNESIQNISTITITFDATEAVPYFFKAEDITTGLIYQAQGTTTIGTGQTAVLTPNDTTIHVAGIISMTLTGASNTLTLEPRIDVKSQLASNTTVVDVGIDIDNADGDNDPTTGTFEQIWMDRNLGASQAAIDEDDALAHGNLYQWGREDDGHGLRVFNGDNPSNLAFINVTTTTLSTTDSPGHSLFIVNGSSPYDWRATKNDNLWQGVSGINNPCPSGYRIPTFSEWNDMLTAFSISNNTDAFNSSLKFSRAGRANLSGVLSINGLGETTYLTSTVSGSHIRGIYLSDFSLSTSVNYGRSQGAVVRCIKD